jgi:Tol biopolymer transport system component
MSQENVKWGRRFVGGVVCVGVLLALVTPAMAAFPGRNGRIAYADPDHGMFSVWPNGAGRHRLVRHGVGPAYSPRGDRIVFWRFFEFRFPGGGFTELGRLELIAANGRRHRVLTGGDDYHPAWAPDGKRIVFARDNPCNRYYNAEGDCPPSVQRDKKYGVLIRGPRGRTRVVTHAFARQPVWSANGRSITYLGSAVSGQLALYAIRPDGSSVREIARGNDDLGFQDQDRSPDGSRIVLGYSTVRGGSGILDIRPDGTGLRRLVRNGWAPAYSPDGRWIVFSRPDERHCGFARHALWVMRANGDHPRVLRYRSGQRSGQRICGYGPDWQPLPR